MSCQIVPPQTTLKICIPRQIANTGYTYIYYTLHEADLEQIHRNVSPAVPFLRLFSEQERRDVIAAAEEKSVAQSGVFVQQVIAPHERKYERDAFA